MPRRPLAALALLALALPSPALASDLTVLPGPDIAADGDVESLVYVLCSFCTDGGRVTAKAAAAEVLSATMLDGILALELRPQARAAPGQVVVQVRGAGLHGKFNDQVVLPVTPIAGQITVTSAADWVSPGDPPVTLTLRPPPGVQDPSHARYAVRASGGTLGPVTVQNNGDATVSWTPPEEARAPQRIVFGVVDLAQPARRVGLASLPLRVKTDLSFQVAPDSSNVLVVGEERVGPVTASPTGALAFSVPLPPDNAQARLETTTRQGATTTQIIDLPLGEGATHLVLPVPAQLPADSRAPVEIVVAALQRDGTPAPAPPTLQASRGVWSAAVPGRLPGLFVAEWTAPKQTGTVEFTAIQGDRMDRWQSTLVEGLPVVRVAVDPDPLPADATRYTITTKASSPTRGLAQAGLPRIEASRGRALGRAQTREGSWSLPMRIPEDAPGTTVQSVGHAPASEQPLAALLAWAAPPLGPAEAAFVTVAAVDAVGLPLPDVELQLAVPVGSGSLPPTARTDRHGVVHLRYDLGSDTTHSVLSVEASGHRLPLVIRPGNQPAPQAGAANRRDLIARWQQVAPLVQVRRQAPAPPAVAAAPVHTDPAAPPPPAAPPHPDTQAADVAAPVPEETGPDSPDTPDAADKPREALGQPWARIGLDAAVFNWTLEQTAQAGGVGPLALQSDLGVGGTLGLQLRALLFPGEGNWGLDLRGGWLTLPQASASTTAPSRDFHEFVGGAGVRYRNTLAGPLGFHVLAQAERTPAFLHLYEGGDPAALDGLTYSLLGARVGGGLHVDSRGFYLETTLSETFAFAPVNLRATAALDLRVRPGILLRLSGGCDWRSMAFEVAEEDVQVDDTLFHTGLGLTIPLR